MRTVAILAGLMLFLVADARDAAAAPARDQTYTIKIKDNPDKGDVYVVNEVEKGTMHVKVAAGDKVVQDKKETKSAVEVYTNTVLQAGTKRAKKYKREYTKAEEEKDKETKKHSYAGRTVVFEEKDGKFQVAADGAPELAAADVESLTKKANNEKGEQSILPLLPEKAVAVGATWPITGKALEKSGADFLIPEKSKGEGKLVKAYTKDGHTWGVVEFKIDAAMRGPKGQGELGAAKMTIALDTAIDGSSLLGKMTMAMRIKGKQVVEQNGMKFDVETDLDQTTTTTRTAKK